MFIPSWPNVPVEPVKFDIWLDDEAAEAFVERLEAAKPPPEVPPPCWDNRPICPLACADATRALCG